MQDSSVWFCLWSCVGPWFSLVCSVGTEPARLHVLGQCPRGPVSPNSHFHFVPEKLLGLGELQQTQGCAPVIPAAQREDAARSQAEVSPGCWATDQVSESTLQSKGPAVALCLVSTLQGRGSNSAP